jgi:hypothetical protein
MSKYLVVEEVDQEQKLLKIVTDKPVEARTKDDALSEFFQGASEQPENRFAALPARTFELASLELDIPKPKVRVKRPKVARKKRG